MPDLRRVRFRFTLRTALVFVAIMAIGLGFWLQWRDLRRAQAILAAHGLAWEWIDLKPGQARATVTRVVDSEMFQIVIVRVDTLQPAKLSLITGPQPRGRTMYTWTGLGKGDTVRENIDVQIKSQVFDIGDRIPLWQVYERHFDMIVQ